MKKKIYTIIMLLTLVSCRNETSDKISDNSTYLDTKIATIKPVGTQKFDFDVDEIEKFIFESFEYSRALTMNYDYEHPLYDDFYPLYPLNYNVDEFYNKIGKYYNENIYDYIISWFNLKHINGSLYIEKELFEGEANLNSINDYIVDEKSKKITFNCTFAYSNVATGICYYDGSIEVIFDSNGSYKISNMYFPYNDYILKYKHSSRPDTSLVLFYGDQIENEDIYPSFYLSNYQIKTDSNGEYLEIKNDPLFEYVDPKLFGSYKFPEDISENEIQLMEYYLKMKEFIYKMDSNMKYLRRINHYQSVLVNGDTYNNLLNFSSDKEILNFLEQYVSNSGIENTLNAYKIIEVNDFYYRMLNDNLFELDFSKNFIVQIVDKNYSVVKMQYYKNGENNINDINNNCYFVVANNKNNNYKLENIYFNDAFKVNGEDYNNLKFEDVISTESINSILNSYKGHLHNENFNSEYILPQSNIRILTTTDINDFSIEEIRLAINEIYARHGLIFSTEEYKNYFNSKSWYQGKISNDKFNSSVFNEYEAKNLEFLIKYEETLKD